jgi:hypothetical protein
VGSIFDSYSGPPGFITRSGAGYPGKFFPGFLSFYRGAFSVVDDTLSQGFTGVFRQADETFDAHSTPDT